MKLIHLFITCLAMPVIAEARYLMYLTGQHQTVPSIEAVSEITHVALAFMASSTFTQPDPQEFPLWTTVPEVRSKFSTGTRIMIAIGGWGDTAGFEQAAKTEESREVFAKNIARMVDVTGADGVDIDWEYPGGNGEDYLRVPNSSRQWEIQAYPLLLTAIRERLGKGKLLSAAVPGLERDMLAFTPSTTPLVDASLDFWNVMTYDLMNRRDNVTKHHAGIKASLDAVDAYIARGVPAEKINLGFAFYVKWFRTEVECGERPVGCRTQLLEDPVTGGDMGQCGAFAWDDQVPGELKDSFGRALEGGKWDEEDGGWWFWDGVEGIWWTWEEAGTLKMKFERVVERSGKKLGGVFAWGLGEDGPEWKRFEALTGTYRRWKGNRVKDEL